jgi:hypothetical protein
MFSKQSILALVVFEMNATYPENVTYKTETPRELREIFPHAAFLGETIHTGRGSGGCAFVNTRIKTSLFIIANENARARGKEVKRCRCCERQRAKT